MDIILLIHPYFLRFIDIALFKTIHFDLIYQMILNTNIQTILFVIPHVLRAFSYSYFKQKIIN